MERKEAIELVMKYDGKCAKKYIKEVCAIMDIKVGEFWRIVDRFVNKYLFEKGGKTGKYKRKYKIGEDYIIK